MWSFKEYHEEKGNRKKVLKTLVNIGKYRRMQLAELAGIHYSCKYSKNKRIKKMRYESITVRISIFKCSDNVKSSSRLILSRSCHTVGVSFLGRLTDWQNHKNYKYHLLSYKYQNSLTSRKFHVLSHELL